MTRFRFALLIAALAFPLALHAATFVVPEDGEMVRRADAIVVGTPVSSFVQVASYGGLETVTEFEVSEAIKGPIGTGRVQVHEPGGELNGQVREIFGAPKFKLGTETILFLTMTPQGTWSATDLVLGKFQHAKSVKGADVMIREESEIIGFEPNGKPHFEPRRDAAKFRKYLREAAKGTRPANDYFINDDVVLDDSVERRSSQAVVAASGTEASVYAAAINASAATYMMTCGGSAGCRWPSFGSGVNWYNQNTEPGAANGGITAFQSALNVWTNECNSVINYRYAGANPAAVGGLAVADGVNAIEFETSLAQYGAAPFQCGSGGTVAMGGITRTSGSHTLTSTNETFYSTVEADVVSNVGLANCSTFLGSGQFLTGLVHELGHTLGFRHANQDRAGSSACPSGYDCSTTAVMNSILVNGLNGVLQQWDINAATRVYPGGSCTTTPPPPAPGSGVRGDFNRDGKPDLLLRNYSTGQNAVWLMNGLTLTAIADLPALPNTSIRFEGTADFDADGNSDIVLRNYANGSNAVWLMNGTSLIRVVDLPALTNVNVHFEGTGDFNADGKPDILLRNYATGANAIWLMNGTSVGAIADLPALPNTNYRFESAADLTGDGRPDIVLRNYSTGQNAVWVMAGVTLSRVSDLPALPNTSYRIDALGDFNGDASPDIVLRNYATGQNATWLMSGLSLVSIRDLPALGNLNYEINGPR
jgi:hypothetical protein